MAKISNPKKAILSALREDSQFKKFRKIVANIEAKIDVEPLLNEAKALHASRTSRKLHDKKQFHARALIDASLRDLSIRSRLVEMRIRVTIQTARLQEAMNAIKHYITTEFYAELGEYKTVDQKRALIDRATAKAQDLMSEGENVTAVFDVLIKDIDQANFSLKLFVESLKLLSDTKGRSI